MSTRTPRKKARQNAEGLTAVQAAWLTDLSPKAVNAAIDKGELVSAAKAVQRGRERRLNVAEVLYLAISKALSGLITRDAKQELYEHLAEANLNEWSYRYIRSELRDCEISLGNGALRIEAMETCKRVSERWEALQLAEKAVVSAPDVRGGEPVIRGTRIPVYMIRDLKAQGADEQEILEDYPSLNAKSLQSALAFVYLYPKRGRPKKAPWKGSRSAKAAR